MGAVSAVYGKCYCENHDYVVDVKYSMSEYGKSSCINWFFVVNSVNLELNSNIRRKIRKIKSIDDHLKLM